MRYALFVEFQAAVATYVGQRPADLRERQNTQHEAFLDRFPISRWLDGDIELDDYALNTPDFRNSYSYFLEWGTPNLGSISGGSSHKHVINVNTCDVLCTVGLPCRVIRLRHPNRHRVLRVS